MNVCMTTGFHGYIRSSSSCAALNVTLRLHLAADRKWFLGFLIWDSEYRTSISHSFHAEQRKKEKRGVKPLDCVLHQRLTSHNMCVIFEHTDTHTHTHTVCHVFHGLTFTKEDSSSNDLAKGRTLL